MARGRPLFSENFSSKRTTSESLPVDIRKAHRAGYLVKGAYSNWRWWFGEDRGEGSTITCYSQGDAMLFLYSTQGEAIRQRVAIEWTPCHYGGSRPWWLCPSCSQRVAVLYNAEKYFACRHCYSLCYKVQKENPSDRALRKAFKIRESLGDDNGLGHLFPQKPKWMRRKTYKRLEREYNEAERETWAVAMRLWG